VGGGGAATTGGGAGSSTGMTPGDLRRHSAQPAAPPSRAATPSGHWGRSGAGAGLAAATGCAMGWGLGMGAPPGWRLVLERAAGLVLPPVSAVRRAPSMVPGPPVFHRMGWLVPSGFGRGGDGGRRLDPGRGGGGRGGWLRAIGAVPVADGLRPGCSRDRPHDRRRRRNPQQAEQAWKAGDGRRHEGGFPGKRGFAPV
jgi:hypothetical protein